MLLVRALVVPVAYRACLAAVTIGAVVVAARVVNPALDLLHHAIS